MAFFTKMRSSGTFGFNPGRDSAESLRLRRAEGPVGQVRERALHRREFKAEGVQKLRATGEKAYRKYAKE